MLALALAGLLASSATPEVRAGGSLRIGNKKQLFIDDFIIASKLQHVTLNRRLLCGARHFLGYCFS